MKLSKWLKMMDIIGLDIVIWGENQSDDEDPIWEGSAYELPFWAANFKISKKGWDGDPPISYRDDLGIDHNNRSGFVITVKE